ncbi:MAG: response regulator [Cyanothece sp. SIO2G6]|nr:response regulator [Cyanothece sp. SIO2G6]
MSLNSNPVIDQPLVVILGDDHQAYGMVVDRFWQEEEVAIRPISSPLPLSPGFGGITLSGDGRVIPLADPVQLSQWIMAKKTTVSRVPPTVNAALHKTETPTILVVDDSIHVRRYLVLTLTRAGYGTEQAKDGHEALDLLKNGLPIQAMICDVEMPRLDGYGVLDAVRKQSQFANLPIIMLTSRSSAKHRKLAMNLGASAYFSKPYNEQQLLQSLIDLGVKV